MRHHDSYLKEAEEFLKICDQFRLGSLPTESPNPKTLNMSHDAKNNLPKAINTIKDIDLSVFELLHSKIQLIAPLQESINEVIKNNGRIFLCGCGATGRLSLALETIWRHQHKDNLTLRDKVVSFMAGGDVALIHSIEKFEDFPEFGERQLIELGFKQGDLLISCTEGGETPFVIGATEAALKISTINPFFLYCNPDDILIAIAERSKNVIQNEKIKKINLSVGPMALTGSTRMQATTILMYAVGLALWFFNRPQNEIGLEISKLITKVKGLDFDFLQKFIECESDIYKNNEFIYYETNSLLGISILTDTTERSPTFSLYPFENQNDLHKKPSLSYLYFPKSPDSASAWTALLGRTPRTFHWQEVTDQTNKDRILGFNFSAQLMDKRSSYLKSTHSFFKIYLDSEEKKLSFELNDLTSEIDVSDLNFLSTHIFLKIALNNLSTLIMGRLNRYESNLMTWVRASNNKLVDRAVRYADILLKRQGVNVAYENLVKSCFQLKDTLPRDESLVLALVEKFKV